MALMPADSYIGYTGNNILHSLPIGSVDTAIYNNRVGRASTITPEKCAEIIELIESGQSLESICKMPGFPSKSQVAAYRHVCPEFQNAIEHARKTGADFMFDRALGVVENVEVVEDKDQKFITNKLRKADILSRVMVRSAESYNPAKYSQKTMSLNANLSVQADADVIADLFTR